MKTQELIDDYKRKVKAIDDIINDAKYKALDRQYYRLRIKRGCYNTFIAELGNLLK